MQFTKKQIIKILASLLILTVLSQAIYTALYLGAKDVPRGWLWSLEGLLFVLVMAVAGAALVQAKQNALGYSAIFSSAILNLVQVGIGLTQFKPFFAAAGSVEGLAPAASSVVALSFFVYNAAKILLGIGAFVFGNAIVKSGGKLLGRVTMFAGVIAMLANTIALFTKIEGLPSGSSGVIATLLLAICLLKLQFED